MTTSLWQVQEVFTRPHLESGTGEGGGQTDRETGRNTTSHDGDGPNWHITPTMSPKFHNRGLFGPLSGHRSQLTELAASNLATRSTQAASQKSRVTYLTVWRKTVTYNAREN